VSRSSSRVPAMEASSTTICESQVPGASALARSPTKRFSSGARWIKIPQGRCRVRSQSFRVGRRQKTLIRQALKRSTLWGKALARSSSSTATTM
jgi:hypothetical protein